MENKEFELSAIIRDEVKDKVDVEPLEVALNSNLRLADYGSTVKKIFFVFVAENPEDTQHENEVKFNAENGILELKLNLSYPNVVKANPMEVQKMMATLFLISIDLLIKLEFDDIDIDQFKQDVQAVLSFNQ